jgi:sulfatase-like protein
MRPISAPVGLAWVRLESVGRLPSIAQDRARRLRDPGQLTELAGERPARSSQRGPATGHGLETHSRQASVHALAVSRGHCVGRSRIQCLAALTLCLTAACGGGARPNPFVKDSLRGWNVLLVTIDTLRFDRVGAYGSTLGLTPTLDRLAAEGQRAVTAYAHVPLTLPSHATLMTGMYPFSNGVRDNGSFRLDGGKPTLAKAFKAAGYRTGAFVGAFVLDARFGLNAGFDVYDDRMTATGGAPEVVQRPAEQVLAPAADWILGESAPAQSAIRNALVRLDSSLRSS